MPYPVRAIVLVLTLALAAGCQDAPPDAPALPRGANAVVERPVDGDTIRVRLGGADGARERVRLIGVDTPETRDPRRPVQCFGKEAAGFTARTLPAGEAVRLVRDVEARDRFGRVLAYVYRARDDLFVNLALVEQGFAQVLTIPPNVAHAEQFVAAATRARQEGRGLWGACTSD